MATGDPVLGSSRFIVPKVKRWLRYSVLEAASNFPPPWTKCCSLQAASPSLCSQSAGFGSEPALFLAYGIFTFLLWQPATCLHPPETLLSVQAGARVSFPAGGRDAGLGLHLLPRYRCFPRGINHPKAFSELWLLDGGEL